MMAYGSKVKLLYQIIKYKKSDKGKVLRLIEASMAECLSGQSFMSSYETSIISATEMTNTSKRETGLKSWMSYFCLQLAVGEEAFSFPVQHVVDNIQRSHCDMNCCRSSITFKQTTQPEVSTRNFAEDSLEVSYPSCLSVL